MLKKKLNFSCLNFVWYFHSFALNALATIRMTDIDMVSIFWTSQTPREDPDKMSPLVWKLSTISHHQVFSDQMQEFLWLRGNFNKKLAHFELFWAYSLAAFKHYLYMFDISPDLVKEPRVRVNWKKWNKSCIVSPTQTNSYMGFNFRDLINSPCYKFLQILGELIKNNFLVVKIIFWNHSIIVITLK